MGLEHASEQGGGVPPDGCGGSRAFFEAVPVPAWAFCAETLRFLAVNDAALERYGYGRDELLALTLADLAPAGGATTLRLAAAHAAAGDPGLWSPGSCTRLHRDGHTVTATAVWTRVDAGAGPPALLETLQTQAAPRAGGALRPLGAIVESASEAIIGRTLDGVVTSWNRGAELLFGYTAEEMVGCSVARLMPGDGAAEVARLTEELIAGTPSPFEVIRRCKDGREILVTSSLSPIHDEQGAIVGVSAISHDVTERRGAEHRLRQLAAIVESSEDGIVSTGLDGTTLTWNGGAELIFGWSAHEVVGRHVVTFVRPEHVHESEGVLDAVRAGRSVSNLETTRVRKDGSLVHVALSASPIYDREGEVLAASVVIRDIGARLQLEQQLRVSQRLEAVGQLAAGVAHDFNNLLVVIRGYSELLGAELEPGPQRWQVEQIDAAAERAARLTAKLLAFGRQQVMQPRIVDVNDVVQEAVSLLDRVIGEDIELKVDLVGDPWPVRVDVDQLGQVLINLAVNAREAMPAGGRILLATRNVAGDETVGDRLSLVVEDTGSGMDEAILGRVFEPFFTTKEHGTGLGLATVYGIVQQSGGTIDVHSSPGEGARFTIGLPRVAGTASGTPAREEPELRSGGETILLVEDSEGVRTFVTEALSGLGYRVLPARHGQEAIELMHTWAEAIAAVVTDVVMPGMSGRELAGELQRDRPGLRVLYTSGHPADAILRDELADDRVAFIAKPFQIGALNRKIRELLDAA